MGLFNIFKIGKKQYETTAVAQFGAPTLTGAYNKFAGHQDDLEPLLHAAINRVATDVAQIPYIVTVNNRSLTTHALYTPANGSRYDFVYNLIYNLIYNGNIWLDINDLQLIYNASPIIDKKTKMLTGWRLPNKTEKSNKDLIHFKLHPLDTNGITGKSILQKLSYIFELSYYADAYLKYNFKNLFNVGGVIIFKSRLNPEAYERLLNQIQQRHAGIENAGKFMLLEGDADFVNNNTKTVDPNIYTAIKEHTRMAILQAIGVPPSIMGILEYANYSNMETQFKLYYTTTINSLLQYIKNKLDNELLVYYGKNYALQWDTSSVRYLQPDMSEAADTYAKLVNAGMSDTEARRIAGI